MNIFQLASQILRSDPTTRNNVPDNLVYTEKPRAAVATKVRQNFLPIIKRTFSPSNQVILSIACGRKGAFLDPKATFLKFKL